MCEVQETTTTALLEKLIHENQALTQRVEALEQSMLKRKQAELLTTVKEALSAPDASVAPSPKRARSAPVSLPCDEKIQVVEPHTEFAPRVVVPEGWTADGTSSFEIIATRGAQPQNNSGTSWTKEGPIETWRLATFDNVKTRVDSMIQEKYQYIHVTETQNCFRFANSIRHGAEIFRRVYHFNASHDNARCPRCKQSFYSNDAYPATENECSSCRFYASRQTALEKECIY